MSIYLKEMHVLMTTFTYIYTPPYIHAYKARHETIPVLENIFNTSCSDLTG